MTKAFVRPRKDARQIPTGTEEGPSTVVSGTSQQSLDLRLAITTLLGTPFHMIHRLSLREAFPSARRSASVYGPAATAGFDLVVNCHIPPEQDGPPWSRLGDHGGANRKPTGANRRQNARHYHIQVWC